MIRIPYALVLLATPLCADALDVFACEPEWGSLVAEIAGDAADIVVATTAFQDPHRLQARPSLIAAARNADLLVCTGADLEVGWLPLLLRRAGNRDIQPGSPGNFMAADFVRRLEIPRSVDRSQGDVHPQGNPHIHLHPRNIARIAAALRERLSQLSPENAALFRANGDDFAARWEEAVQAWQERAAKFEGMRLVAHHRSFSYLADWLGLDMLATLEPRPGIPVSGAQLAQLIEVLEPDPPRAIVRAPFENEKASLWLSERLDVPAVILPYTVGGSEQATDLFLLYEDTLTRLEDYRL